MPAFIIASGLEIGWYCAPRVLKYASCHVHRARAQLETDTYNNNYA